MLQSSEYQESRRRIDMMNAKALQDAEIEYQQRLEAYNKMLNPEYSHMRESLDSALQMSEEERNQIKQKKDQIAAQLESLYESTHLIPPQYRNEAALSYIYSTLSGSQLSFADAVMLYENALQRSLEAQRIEEQQRTNALLDERNDLLDEQNELLHRRNQIIHDHLRRY